MTLFDCQLFMALMRIGILYDLSRIMLGKKFLYLSLHPICIQFTSAAFAILAPIKKQ